MRYEVYRCKSSSDADFELTNQLYKRIVSEDKDLCTSTQEGFGMDVSVSRDGDGIQTALRDLTIGHLKSEEELGRQIWPSRQILPTQASISQDDVDFCAQLSAKSQGSADCSTQSGGCCGGGCAQAGNNDTLAY